MTVFSSTLSDTLTTSDVGRVLGWSVSSSGAVILVENQPKVFNWTKQTSEALTLSDFKLRTLVKTLSEALSTLDAAAGVKVKPRLSSDSITLTDADRRLTWAVTLERSLTMLDELVKSVASGFRITKITSDTLLITDGTIRLAFRARILLDALTIFDATSGSDLTASVIVTDPLDLPDTPLTRLLRSRIDTEGLTLLDFIVRVGIGNSTITELDSIVFTDQLVRGTVRTEFSDEFITTTDELSRSMSRLLQMLDSITPIDGTLNVRMWNPFFEDFVVISEESAVQIIRQVIYEVRVILGVGVDPVLGAY